MSYSVGFLELNADKFIGCTGNEKTTLHFLNVWMSSIIASSNQFLEYLSTRIFSYLKTNGGIKSFQLVQHTRQYLPRRNISLVHEHLYVNITFTIRILFNPPTSAIDAINSTGLPVVIIIMQFLPNTCILEWESKSNVLSPNSFKLITIQRAYDILKYRS